jgi:hypothetical protein
MVIDQEVGQSTLIRVTTEVREMIESEKIIPREPASDCIKRVFVSYLKSKNASSEKI